MAERNVTFLILAKDFASRTMDKVGSSTDRAAQKLRDLNVLGLGPVATAGAALGPALLPVVGGAVVATAGLGVAFAATGAAAAIFGAVVKTTFTEVADAAKKTSDLRAKISLLQQEQRMAAAAGDVKAAGAYEKAAAKATMQYRAQLALLPPDMRNAVTSLGALEASWKTFTNAQKPVVLGLMSRGMAALTTVIPKLQPLFDAAAGAATGLVGAFEQFVSNGMLDRLVSFLSTRAGPAFESFGGILISFGYGVGQLLAPFIGTTDGVIGGLDRMSLSFAKWSRESGRAGVQKFIDYVSANAGRIGPLLLGIASSLGTLAQAAAPLAPISLAVATSLTTIIDAIPQPVLTAMIGSFIAWSVALRGAMIVTKLGAAVGIFAGILTGVTTALVGATLAENASTAAKVAFAITTGIATAAQWAWNAALWVGAAAMTVLTSPIFLIIAGIALLAAGFIYAYKHSERFHAIVQAAIGGVVTAVHWLGDALSSSWLTVQGWWSAAEGAFGAVGRAAVALGGWFTSAWDTVQRWYRNTIDFFTALPGRILNALVALPGQYVRLWQFTMERAAYYIGFAIGWTIRQMIELPGRIVGALSSLGGMLWGVITGAWGRATSATATGYRATLHFFQALPGQARAGLAALGSYVWGQITGAWNRARSAAGSGARATIAFFSALPGQAGRAMSSLWSRISGAFSSTYSNSRAWASRAVSGAVSFFASLPGRARSAVSGLPGQIRAVFSGAGSWLISAGRDIIMGLVRGIGNAVGAAVGEARRIASSIVGGVRAGLGIGSPSKVMADQVGRWIPPGIAMGLTSAMPGLLGTVRSAVGAVTSAATATGSGSWDMTASSSGAGPASLPAGVGYGGGSTIVLQVSGALDPLAVGQQLVQILQRWARSNGKTFELAT